MRFDRLNDAPHATDIIAVFTGSLLLYFGFRMWTLLAPAAWYQAVAMLYVYAAAFAHLGSAVTDIDTERYTYHLALIALISACVGAFSVYLSVGPRLQFGTDALLFSRYSVDQLLAGANPYAISMAAAEDHYSTKIQMITPREDGSVVSTFSYPAGHILAFLPQRLADVGRTELRITPFAAIVGAAALLIYDSPRAYAIAPVGIFLAARNFFLISTNGITDGLWLLPVLVSMRYWYQDRYRGAAIALGIACSIKQTPWLITPFLAVWLAREAESWRAFGERASRCLAWGVGTFLAINLPFIVWAPRAWLSGVFTPIRDGVAPLVMQGSGVVTLSVTNTYALPKWWYTATMLGFMATLLVCYALYFERVKWIAWAAPMIILFFNYRSLNNYFSFFAPVVLYAVYCARDMVQLGTPAILPADAPTPEVSD